MILPPEFEAVQSRCNSIAYMRRMLAAARTIMDNARPGTPVFNVGKLAFDQLSATLEEVEVFGDPISSFTHRLPSA